MKQRELKFRVWDVKRSNFINDDDLQFFFIDCKGNIYSNQYGLIILNQENYIIQQFTGLKDKNGKEIYEGDIVEWQWGTMLYGNCGDVRTGVVRQNKYGKWVIAPFEDLERPDYGYPFDNDFRDNRDAELEVEIVVGNIFENSELLKK